MKISVILVLIITIAFVSVIAQIGENYITITITSDGKAKVSQVLFPKTYVSTIDAHLISNQISNMLVTDEKDIFLGTTQNEDSVKIATLGASTVDLKYNADVISYESGIFRLKYNSEQESRVILPPLSKIVSINTIPIEVNERNYILPSGDISVSYTIRPVTSQEFIIPVGGNEQKIEAITAAKIEEFAVNDKEIQFIIKDKATVLIIIPTLVLANPDDITLNNEPVDFREFHQNSTHSWIRIEPHEKGLVKIFDSTPVSDDGGGCLIATAAYGSEMAPQVQFLREIRDNKVMSTASGASFMTGFNQLYYSFSPTIADLERENPAFKEMVKIGITPMISSLSIMSAADSEQEILGYGIGVILMNVGMYFALPVMICYEVKRVVRTRHKKRSNWSLKLNINAIKALKTSLFGVVVLALSVSVSSAFAQSAESESPIKTILDLTRENLLESLESTSEIPPTAQTFYDMGQVEYEKAIAALEEGDTEAAREHALIAMALYEDSASIIGSLEESRVLDQLPGGFGKAVGSASEQGLEKGQGLGVGGIPPGIMKQLVASNIFEMQEEITDVEIEVENLKDLISSNNLNIDLAEYDKTINLAKEVLANGDIPNAQAKLALANEIKSELYNQINLAVEENQDERIDEFVQKSIRKIEELLSKGENLGLTKKAISELEDTLEALKSGNIDDALEKTNDKSKFANEVESNTEKDENKENANNEDNGKPDELPNGFEAAGDNPSENGVANGQGLGLGKIPPGIAKLFGYDEGNEDNSNDEETSEGLPPGFGAAGDNPSENGVANGQGLGLGKIPPGLTKFDSFEDTFDSNPDDYFENHFEGTFEDTFEVSFDGTNKGHGNGKGNLGDVPGKSGESGNNKSGSKVKGNSGGGNPNCNNEGITDGESTVIIGTEGQDFTVQGFTGIGSNCNDVTDQIKIKIERPSNPKVFANAETQPYTFKPNEPGIWTITASAVGQFETRTISVASASGNTLPVISLLLPYNDPDVILWANVDAYIADEILNPNATASDIQDGDITNSIVVTHNKGGGYKIGDIFSIFYDVTDSGGLAAITIQRDVQSECPPGEVPNNPGNACVSGGGGGATVPDAPTNVGGIATSSTSIDISWTAPADDGGSAITGYKIERKIATGNNPWIIVDSDTSPDASVTYSDNTVSADTKYRYKVSAINDIGTGPESAQSGQIQTPL